MIKIQFMIKQALPISFCLFGFFITNAQGIRFENNLSWSSLLTKARVENKFIFMDAYTTWCGPCKAMAEQIFPLREVGEAINNRFISVKVQMDKTTKDNEFIRSWYADAEGIAKKSNLTAYPTILFFSPDGKLVHKAVGYRDALGLIAEVANALSPSTQFFVLLDKFNEGKLDTAQMRTLGVSAKQMGDDSTASLVAQKYLQTIPGDDIFKKEYLSFMERFLSSSKDPNFRLFLTQAKKIDEILGKNVAENAVMRIISQEEVRPFESRPDWKFLEKRIIRKYGALGEERVWGHMLLYYSEQKDWKKFGRYYKKYFERAVRYDRSFIHINNLSWPVFEHINDHRILTAAVRTMKYDIEKFDGNDPQAIDTYANLLYKLGRRQEALTWEEKAVELSKNEKSLVETLEKMKRGEPTWPTN